jgi:pimeloyl-ACP methyl ester carboxylesterase
MGVVWNKNCLRLSSSRTPFESIQEEKGKRDMILKVLILIAVLAAFLLIAYFVSRRRLRARLASQSQVIQTAIGLVEFIDVGSGPVVVHMHGMLGGFDHWKWCEFLVKSGFRVIVPSRPGYLRTPLTSGRIPAEQAALVAALLDTLGIKRVALYAYSQGGASSLQFAWTYPERCWGLILFSALTRPQPELNKILPYIRVFTSLDFLLWMLGPVLLSWIMAQAKKALPVEIQKDREKMTGIREILGAAFQASLRGQGFANDFANSVSWPGLPVDQLRTSTLIIHGCKDVFIKLADSMEAAQAIPGARFIALEGAGHEALSAWMDQIEHPVLDFLRIHIPRLEFS